MEQEQNGISSYRMVGASLDTLPLGAQSAALKPRDDFELDTENDFLARMPRLAVRVGALQPVENDRVRVMVAKLPRRNMTLVIQNRFIEHVLEEKRI